MNSNRFLRHRSLATAWIVSLTAALMSAAAVLAGGSGGTYP
jgi:hypothetical protein